MGILDINGNTRIEMGKQNIDGNTRYTWEYEDQRRDIRLVMGIQDKRWKCEDIDLNTRIQMGK